MVLALLPIHLGEPRLPGHETVVLRDASMYVGRHKLKIAFLEACIRASGLPIVDDVPTDCLFYDPLDCEALERFRGRTARPPLELRSSFVLQKPHLDELHARFSRPGTKQVQHRVFFEYAKQVYGILEDVPSQDALNRRPLPRTHRAVARKPCRELRRLKHEVVMYVEREYAGNPGSCAELAALPVTRRGALAHLRRFLRDHLAGFGPYEDAIHVDDVFVHHSHCSFLLNVGLLTPRDVLEAVRRSDAPLSSREGLVRQVLGWREYMRYIYRFYGERLQRGLFDVSSPPFEDYVNTLDTSFVEGRTGIDPIDGEVAKLHRWAWAHHIVRLMVFLNHFHRRRVRLSDMYAFFMNHVALDAYPWVMVSNLAAMGHFTVPGVPYFMRKRYVTGAAYLLRMSNYRRGEWCGRW